MANLQELTERLLSRQYQQPGRPGQVRLLPDQLPADLPFDFPVPNGAQLVGTGSSIVDGKTVRADIIFDAAGNAEGILDFYGRAAAERGWTTAPSLGPRGGFAVQ